jgi:hypothetical protein
MLSGDLDLITDNEVECDSEEVHEKWELGLLVASRVGRREPQACPDLIFSGKGRKTT